jgi:hypothetical protein
MDDLGKIVNAVVSFSWQQPTPFDAMTSFGATGFARRAILASLGAIRFVRRASLVSLGEVASSGAITIGPIGTIGFVRCGVIGLIRSMVMG